MDAFHDLLEATISHLEGLKARGTRFLPVSPETLHSLAAAPAGSSLAAKSFPSPPAPPPAPVRRSQPVERIVSSQPVVLSPDLDKAAAMRDLRERALICQKCANLANSRKNVVFGVGSIDADLMFVGEAPGADEDEQGEPFVGRAGQLLTKIIQTMGL